MARIFALVAAAGQGTRLGDSLPKQYLPLAGKPLMHHALAALAGVRRIEAVLVVLAPGDMHWQAMDFGALPGRIEAAMVGGATRAESVANGIRHLGSRVEDEDWILVHDAARPCITGELVEGFIDAIGDDAVGGLVALPVADTLKRAGADGRVEETPSRDGLWRAQTPQMFRRGVLARGLEKDPHATDEARAVEALGLRPKLFAGPAENIKVTFPGELALAELVLARARR